MSSFTDRCIEKHIDRGLVSKRYLDFYSKKSWRSPARAMNLKNMQYIAEAVEKSKTKLHDVCAFAPSSYMNIVRANESGSVYLDEAARQTADTSKLIDEIKSYCRKNTFKLLDDEELDKVLEIECYDPDESGKIFGNIMLLDFPFNVSSCSADKHVEVLSRRAMLLGYNFVAMSSPEETVIDGVRCALVSIQFEATYFSSNVKSGDILYHITPKSLVPKIMARGLVPSNRNNHGFSYGSRVYCFIDRDDLLMKSYASSSGKTSKKFINKDRLAFDVLNFYKELQTKTSGMLFSTFEFTMLAVDTAKLDDVEFYRDNTFDISGRFVAVYTEKSIPPKAIDIVCDIIATPSKSK